MEIKKENQKNKFIENVNFIALVVFIAWYILPIAKIYFNGTIFNIIMSLVLLTFFMTAYMLAPKKFWVIGKHTITVIICIVIYIINMFIRKEAGNPIAYAKIGIIFWVPVIMNNLYMHYYSNSKKKALIHIILLYFILTTIPTMMEVFANPGAIRELSYGGVDTIEDYSKVQRNVGTFSYVYGLAIIIPFLLHILIETKNKKLFLLLTLVSIITLIKASFTIAIIITAISMLIYYLTSRKNITHKIMVVAISILIVVISFNFLPNLLINLSNNIDNKYFKQRIIEIADFMGGNASGSGDLTSRLELYKKSFDTFLKHPIIGVGGYYYIEFNNPGIGYHSQILDDMARYGIFSLFFVIIFFYYYRKNLLKISTIETNKRIINTTIFGVLLLALINPCFNNEWISIILFILLPTYCSLEKEELNEKNSEINLQDISK